MIANTYRNFMVKFLLFTTLCIIGSSHADVATDEFTSDLLKAIYTQDGVKKNTVLSAVSLYDVAALLHQGSGGYSAQELTRVLHADSSTTKHHYAQLVHSLKHAHTKTQLEIAKKVYLENRFKVEQSFKNVATQDFHADIDNIEFIKNIEAAAAINQWVSDSTHGRIKKVIDPDSLSGDTEMVLLDAVYFAGNFTYQFDAHGTEKKSFTTLERQVKSVPMMHLSAKLVAGESAELDAKFVRLPFEGDEFSMIFVVPNAVDGLTPLIDAVHKDHVERILSFKDYRNVDLSLPKFKYSTTSKLVPVLKKLGVHDIFIKAANLTGITHVYELFVSEIVQKAEIEVDERGVKAAAPTALMDSNTSVPSDVFSIKADHPFMFFIIDDADSLPVFSGWVAEP